MDKFAALSEPNRRRIIELLARHGEMPATQISKQFEISAPAVSQHLKVLRNAEILSMRKQAQQRIYRINTSGVNDLWEWLNTVRLFWCNQFDQLEHFLTSNTANKEHKHEQ